MEQIAGVAAWFVSLTKNNQVNSGGNWAFAGVTWEHNRHTPFKKMGHKILLFNNWTEPRNSSPNLTASSGECLEWWLVAKVKLRIPKIDIILVHDNPMAWLENRPIHVVPGTSAVTMPNLLAQKGNRVVLHRECHWHPRVGELETGNAQVGSPANLVSELWRMVIL